MLSIHFCSPQRITPQFCAIPTVTQPNLPLGYFLSAFTTWDIEPVKAIIRDALYQYLGSSPKLAEIIESRWGDLEDFKTIYSPQNRGWLRVLRHQGQAVGVVCFNTVSDKWLNQKQELTNNASFTLTDKTAQLQRLYLSKECRGKGLGQQLLTLAEHTAKSMGYDSMMLQSSGLLTDAIKLYEKSGFVAVKPNTPSEASLKAQEYIGVKRL